MIHGPLWALESCLSIHHDYFLEHTALPFLGIFKNHLHLASPPMIPLSFHPADPIETLPLDSHLKSWSQPGTLPPAYSNHRFFNFPDHSCSQLTAAWGHLGTTEGSDVTCFPRHFQIPGHKSMVKTQFCTTKQGLPLT